MVLRVERGRADMLSLHTATLALVEALLVGMAVRRPEAAMASLRSLNALRKEVAGDPADLDAAPRRRGRRRARKQP